MKGISIEAFSDELEKLGGLKRLERLSGAMERLWEAARVAKTPEGVLNGIRKAERVSAARTKASLKLRRRMARYSGGEKEYLERTGLRKLRSGDITSSKTGDRF